MPLAHKLSSMIFIMPNHVEPLERVEKLLNRDCSSDREINYVDWMEIFKDHRELREKKKFHFPCILYVQHY